MYSAAAAVGRALFSEGQLEDPNIDEDRLVVVLAIEPFWNLSVPGDFDSPFCFYMRRLQRSPHTKSVIIYLSTTLVRC